MKNIEIYVKHNGTLENAEKWKTFADCMPALAQRGTTPTAYLVNYIA